MLQIANFPPAERSGGSCRNCIARQYCLPQTLEPTQLRRYEALIRHKTLHRGDRLFQQGEAFKSLYMIHSGSFKAYLISDNGEHQITGFHFQGELLGLDGLECGQQVYSADALETSSVCELPYCLFESLMEKIPSLRRELVRHASRELAREKNRMMVLGKMHAGRKLAEFFLDIAQTMQDKGRSRKDFMLPMTRQDIANYLGLAVETVSRLLTHFQNTGLIKIKRRNVSIVNHDNLRSVVMGGNARVPLDKIA